MRRTLLFCMLCACALCLCACSGESAGTVSQSGWVAPQAETERARTDEVTLYFRFGDTAYLAGETRALNVSRNQSVETAIVQMLLRGPVTGAPQLTSLFPPGTEVLSTQAQGDTLFVTFNEALLSRYPDEPTDHRRSAYWQTEAPLRRRLCMASLTDTLTEYGDYTGVQVLVLQKSAAGTSMRLKESYYLTDSDALLTRMTRDESVLLTAPRTAELLLKAWREADYGTMYQFLSAQDANISREAFDGALSLCEALVAYGVSGGTVSPDGQTATHCADVTLLGQDGQTRALSALPFRLVRENGVWRVTYAQLLRLMQLR